VEGFADGDEGTGAEGAGLEELDATAIGRTLNCFGRPFFENFLSGDKFLSLSGPHEDREAKEGSLVVKVPSPACAGRKLLILKRGNTIELAYVSGKPGDAGPAEMQFVFEEGQQLHAFENVIRSLKKFISEETIIVREKYWIRRQTQLRFCPRNESRMGAEILGSESWLGTCDSNS
jgi:hypothetical protein